MSISFLLGPEAEIYGAIVLIPKIYVLVEDATGYLFTLLGKEASHGVIINK